MAQGLQFMLEVEDDPDWLTADTTDDDDDSTRYILIYHISFTCIYSVYIIILQV